MSVLELSLAVAFCIAGPFVLEYAIRKDIAKIVKDGRADEPKFAFLSIGREKKP